MRPSQYLIIVVASLAIVFAACEDDPGVEAPDRFSTDPTAFPDPSPVTLASSAIVGVGFLPNGTACAVSIHGMFLSADGGTTWTPAGSLPPGENIRSLAIDGSGTIFLGADSLLERLDPHEIYPLSLDVLRSNDLGSTWKKVSSLSRPIMNALILSCNRRGDIITGYHASGFAISRDKGDNWTIVSGYWCSGAAVSDSRTLFTASTMGNVRRSDDLGATWARCPGLAGDGQGSYLSVFTTPDADTVFVQESTDPGTLFRSVDGGTVWEPVWAGFATAMCRSPRGVFYLASRDELYRSLSGGARWSITGRPGAEITSLAVSDGGTVLVGTRTGTVVRWEGE